MCGNERSEKRRRYERRSEKIHFVRKSFALLVERDGHVPAGRDNESDGRDDGKPCHGKIPVLVFADGEDFIWLRLMVSTPRSSDPTRRDLV